MPRLLSIDTPPRPPPAHPCAYPHPTWQPFSLLRVSRLLYSQEGPCHASSPPAHPCPPTHVLFPPRDWFYLQEGPCHGSSPPAHSRQHAPTGNRILPPRASRLLPVDKGSYHASFPLARPQPPTPSTGTSMPTYTCTVFCRRAPTTYCIARRGHSMPPLHRYTHANPHLYR